MKRMLLALVMCTVTAGMWAQAPPKETPKAVAPPTLTIEQKLTLKDKFRDADEAARLASPDQLAKEIAAFMVARTNQAQEKNAAAVSYYNSLPSVDGYVITRDGEYVKQK